MPRRNRNAAERVQPPPLTRIDRADVSTTDIWSAGQTRNVTTTRDR
jgi:hypothetical protein